MFITQNGNQQIQTRSTTNNNSYQSFRNKSSTITPTRCFHRHPSHDLTKQSSNNSNLFKPIIMTPQNKWNQIIQLYTLSNKNLNSKKQKIYPGISFYKYLLMSNLNQINVKINFPQTIMMDNQGFYQMVYTDNNGFIRIKLLEKQKYFTQLNNSALKFCDRITNTLKYHKQCDYRQNSNAPVVIAKSSEDYQKIFETEVQTYRSFLEKRPKPTRNKFIQRYIYSRNMKCMIIRYCYEKCQKGQQRQEYYAYRFQNMQPIFKVNPKTQAYQFHKLTSTITLSQKRLNTIQYSKITNKKGLQKFMAPTNELKNILERSTRTRIKKLYLDYIIDLFDQPWLINIKYLQTIPQICQIPLNHQLQFIIKASTCKLCNNIYPKDEVQKILSLRMLAQFIQHLQKRTKIEDLDTINFTKNININLKENRMCCICQYCYNIVMQELQLIKYQRKFANICNIDYQQEFLQKCKKNKDKPATPNILKQWRLMVYIVQIKNFSRNMKQNLNLHYKICQTIQQSYKCKHTDNQTITINKLKIHYFYSQNDQQLQQFLKQTEISIFLTMQKDATAILAKGFTCILRNFKPRITNGQRQTSIILLFFDDNSYCQLTVKVGLVCDGCYSTKDMNLYTNNFVYFPEKWFHNSNPFPKEWMEIFAMNYQSGIQQIGIDDINDFQQRLNRKVPIKKKLKKRPIL